MPSFDVVSTLDKHEVDNAINQAAKEVGQRYDFRGTNTSIEQGGEGVTIKSDAESLVEAAYEVLMSKMAKRGVSMLSLDPGAVEAAGGSSYRKTVALKEGIWKEKAKLVVKIIKESKLKVQASIQGEAVRVSGKKRDFLQETIALLKTKEAEVELPMQYQNFRD